MAKYRKKPVVIEAVLWTGDNISEVKDFVDFYVEPDEENNVNIQTLEGTMKAVPGAYIIRGVQGEFYPCDAEIFGMTYEPVE